MIEEERKEAEDDGIVANEEELDVGEVSKRLIDFLT